MKILHVINNLGSGGAEKFVEQFVPLMNEKENVQADVLLLTDVGNVFDEHLKDNGVNVTVVPLRNPKNPLNVFYLKRHIVQGNYDVVHAHLFPTLYWVSMASRLIRRGKPLFVFTEHSTHNRRRENLIFRPLEKFVYSGYDVIISVSKEVHENLTCWLGKENDHRFIVIPNGIDVMHFREAKSYKKEELSPTLTEQTKLHCMIGRFSEAKDQQTVIRSMELVPEHVHLLLVGEGSLKGENQELAKKLNLQHRVHFLGFRRDIARILKTSDVIILSSHWEGLPLAALEGMAAVRPVVASDVPGLADIVRNYGELFCRGDHHALARIINRLLSNTDEYHYVAHRCAERALCFDILATVDAYLEAYESIMCHNSR